MHIWFVRALLAFSLTLAGCGSLGGPPADSNQERCQLRPGKNDPSLKPRPTPGNHTFPVALTSQGELVDRCQWTDLMQELAVPAPTTVALYVHGWKHDSADDDPDRLQFEKFVNALAANGAGSFTDGPPRRVVGVYVGWPAATLKVPILENLTYWGRQKAADRISQAAIVAKLIASIRSVRQRWGKFASNSTGHDLFVFVGHSFGARILLTATSQLQLQEIQTSHPGTVTTERGLLASDPHVGPMPSEPYLCIKGVGDLTILLNPAVEAYTYTAFNAVRRDDHSFSPGQQPVMVTIASEADRATRIAFPLGQLAGLNWHKMEVATIGNYPPFWTHVLSKEACLTKSGQGQWWFDQFPSNSICLSRVDRHLGNPFIVARATSDVIGGHNEIWRDPFAPWMLDFVRTLARERAKDTSCR
jgi:hypothetical protein